MSSNPQSPTPAEIEAAVKRVRELPMLIPRIETRDAIRTVLAVLELYQKDSERLDYLSEFVFSGSHGYGEDGQRVSLDRSTHVLVSFGYNELPVVPRDVSDYMRAAIDKAKEVSK